MRAGRRDLAEALLDLVSVPPEEHTAHGVRCHHCLAREGRPHDAGCPWIEAMAIVGEDEQVKLRRVGEDEEDFADRLLDEDDDREESRSSTRERLAALLGPDAPPRGRAADVVEEVLDDPLDEGEPFEP